MGQAESAIERARRTGAKATVHITQGRRSSFGLRQCDITMQVLILGSHSRALSVHRSHSRAISVHNRLLSSHLVQQTWQLSTINCRHQQL